MNLFLEKLLKLENFWSIVIYICLITFLSWILSKIVRSIIVLVIKRKQKDEFGKTSILFLRNSIRFFIAFLAIIYIIFSVPVFRNKAAFIFSGAGILAAIIGFAAQAAISNLIAGVFIVIFKPFRIGDFIKLDSLRTGIVEDITLRHTVINNFENKRLIIPNSVISTESVLNHTIDDAHILSFNNFLLGLQADIDLARKIILEEVKKLDFVLDTRISSKTRTTTSATEIRVIDVTDSYIHIRAYVWINDPFKEFKIKCALKEAVHKEFVKQGVDLPIPLRRILKESEMPSSIREL